MKEEEVKKIAFDMSQNISIKSLLMAAVSTLMYFVFIVLWVKNGISIYFCVLANGFVLYPIFVSMHECIHNSLIPNNKKINNILGSIFGFLLFIPFFEYSKIHIEHHKNANSKNDPDYVEQGNKKHIFMYPLKMNFVRTIAPIPFVTKIINKIISRDLKLLIYLWRKRKNQVKFYRICILLILSSLLIMGDSSPFLVWYLSAAVSTFIGHFMFTWLPHGALFERKTEKENKYKTSKIYKFKFSSFLMINQDKHLTHHLFPSVPVGRLSKFDDCVSEYIEFKRNEIYG